MTYWAHSDPDRAPQVPGNRWQLLSEHLQSVAEIARDLAERATVRGPSLGMLAFTAGMLHDYGKYQECFQRKLQGFRSRCPHAIYGALALRQMDGTQRQLDRMWLMPAVCAVAAHHAGLKDVYEHHNATRPDSPAVREEREIAERLFTTAVADQPRVLTALGMQRVSPQTGSEDLRTRMLLSCLVDADRLNTAGCEPVQQDLCAAQRLQQLTDYLNGVSEAAKAKGTASEVLFARSEVQRLCREAAKQNTGLFSLSVPTGGGKTLAAMRFALQHATARPQELRRVIVVIPYLSIIEQNAKVYREVFGPDAVLEHHSGTVYSSNGNGGPTWPVDEEESADGLTSRTVETENWDAPVIVTTSVRFFESLFSNHPSDLRRIHNIARSVIVLDEVQTLPRRLLAPLLGILRELTEDWGCTVVLSTATQPAFETRGARQTYGWPEGTVKPIIPPETAAAMAHTLQRVSIDWEIETPVSWRELAARLVRHPQVLCVVNLRDHATAVFDALRSELGDAAGDGLLHLSTRMCAEHRLRVLDEVRERLREGLSCRIVSTQLIEAGVDLDVPVAYRALGPLDSIIQVAGRVDREGRATASAGAPAGKLVVFLPQDDRLPGKDYKDATVAAKGVLDEFDEVETCDLDAVGEFFRRYYGIAGENSRGEDLARMRAGDAPQFRSLADAFEMIDSRTISVFVPYGEGAEILRQLANAKFLNLDLLRRLQRYTVSLQPYEFEAAKTQGLREVWAGSNLWTCEALQYSAEKGLLPQLPANAYLQ